MEAVRPQYDYEEDNLLGNDVQFINHNSDKVDEPPVPQPISFDYELAPEIEQNKNKEPNLNYIKDELNEIENMLKENEKVENQLFNDMVEFEVDGAQP